MPHPETGNKNVKDKHQCHLCNTGSKAGGLQTRAATDQRGWYTEQKRGRVQLSPPKVAGGVGSKEQGGLSVL